MWTWIYYTIITFGAIALCSTASIIQIMGSANDKKEEEDISNNSIDLESGDGSSQMHHRKVNKETLHF